MKKTVMGFMLAAVSVSAMVTGCQSKEQKVEDAQQKVEDAKQDLRDAKNDLNQEYPSYRKAEEEQIIANDKRIDDLRAKINTGGKPLDNYRARKIDDLKKQNDDLRARLYGYEKAHGDWESFKREFNHDMEGLDNSIKDFGKDNTK